jgi:citrate synthase
MMRAIGIPSEMFTVIFAIGRMPGWIANYREVSETEAGRICRPRQIYVGEPLATYVPVAHRTNA